MDTITLEQIFDKQIKASHDITEEEKEEREKVQQEIEVLAKELEEIKSHRIKKNITVSVHDSSRIEALIGSVKIGEFKKAGEFFNTTIFVDNRTELTNFGWTYAALLKDEFTNETNNKLKFETDFKTEVDCSPKLNLTQFIDSEIERLKDINELIVTCFRKSRAYRKLEQYMSMCNYLEFLQSYEQAPSQIENTPFLQTTLGIIKLKNIFNYLVQENVIIKTDITDWLHWFDIQLKDKPKTIKWNGAKGILPSIIYHICGGVNEKSVTKAFGLKGKFPSYNRKDYESAKSTIEKPSIHKKINQIINTM